MEVVRDAVDNDSVAGIVASSGASSDLELFGQEVDELALA